MRHNAEPVGGKRRTVKGDLFGNAPPQKPKPQKSVYIPGLNADAVQAITAGLRDYSVQPVAVNLLVPGHAKLNGRKEVSAFLEKTPRPADRAEWALTTPLVGRIALGSICHVGSKREPYESFADIDAVGASSVVSAIRGMQPPFILDDAPRTRSYTYDCVSGMSLPVIMRRLPILNLCRGLLLSDNNDSPKMYRHTAQVALVSALVMHPEWHEMLDEPSTQSASLGPGAAEVVDLALETGDTDVLVPVATSLVLSQQWSMVDTLPRRA